MQPRGPEIAEARKQLGLKRSELARRAGISYQHVYNLECGYNGFAVETAHRIATELGLSLDDIAKVEPGKPASPGTWPTPTKSPEPVRPVAPPRPTKTKSASAA